MKRQFSKMFRNKNILFNTMPLVALSFCLLSVSCKNQQQQGQAPSTYKVMVVKNDTCTLTTTYTCSLKGNGYVEIRPKISGFIFNQYVQEGDFVHKGQLLFRLDPVQVEAQVNVAKANIKVAEANVETSKLTVATKTELFKKNIISEYELSMAKNDLKSKEAVLAQAKANLTNAKREMEYTNITSPTDGIVGVISYSPGNLVGPSAQLPLTVVSDIGIMRAYFSLSERQVLNMTRQYGSADNIVKSMPAVQLRLSDGTLFKNKGKIITISGVTDQNTGAIRIRADFPNPNYTIKSGFTGNVLIPTHLDTAIIIPQKASFEVQDKKFVYAVNDSNMVYAIPIEVHAINDGNSFVVLSGLKAGDRIVIEGANFLREKQTIIPELIK
ncbi:MAG: efflux RND transporter periplasmic adaptor subunit [Bacteroidales bacterium]